MSADDTSREALVERVADVIHRYEAWNVTADRLAEREWELLVAGDVIAKVVMPLVEERDRLRAERAPYDFVLSNDGTVRPTSRRAIEWERDELQAEVDRLAGLKALAQIDRDAAIKRAEAAEREARQANNRAALSHKAALMAQEGMRAAEAAKAALEAVRARLADDQPVSNLQTDVYAILDRFS